MFKNIGKKIKTLAKIIFWLIMIIGISLGFILFVMAGSAWDEDTAMIYKILGIFSIVLSFVISIFSSYFMYGFGELIDKTCDIEKNTRGTKSNTNSVSNRKEKLDKLLSQRLITEEEYQEAIKYKNG